MSLAGKRVEVIDVVQGRRFGEWMVIDEIHTFLPGEMEALAEKIAALERRCVCGRRITDGPFRFCCSCRQVDLGSLRNGG
jgi:hypothetical protein